PYYKDLHRRIRKLIRHFVDTDVIPFAHEWDEAKRVPMFLIKKCAEMGILAAVAGNGIIPLEYFDLESTFLFRGDENAIVPRKSLRPSARAYAISRGSEEIMLDLGMRQSIKVSMMNCAQL
ncbi:hypothetical protein BG006_002944, partial [Podila minutissima]